jgi:hypothetical protein
MTIIAGGSRCNGRYFGWHLQRTDRGQTVAVRDVVGLMGENMHDWFEQMEAMAAGGNTTNFFYHFSLSPREDEPFTDEQRKVAVATALENLGLEDQPYFLVEHGGKDGRSPHYHCIVLRVDLDTGKAISDSHNFGHEHTERGRGLDGPNPKGYEVQRGQETGIDPKDVKAELTALYRQCDTGQAFAAALEERGYVLARGDRRPFVIVDPAGDDHAVGRRSIGVTAAEIHARMADLDRDALPSVQEARALARERAAERDASARDASPLPADPAARRDDKGVEPIAQEPAHAVTDPITEQKQPPAADVPEPSKDASTPKPEPPTGFDRLAHDMIAAAEKAAPALLAATEVLAAEEHPQEVSRELTAFERIAEKLTQAMRAWGGEPSVSDSLDWLARQITTAS